ncbi:flavodoxin family protein [Candidatus Macondimonas diazotrophica]|nr:NAD(P)H-dependent oxidoreductase [Candidatus Macondimonas diazotrophica]
MSVKNLLIVFHSQTGNTERLAEAAMEGATGTGGVSVRRLWAKEAAACDLLWADGVLFGTPENLGYLSGGLKDFFDRTYYAVQDLIQPLPYGLFISAGNDGRGAAQHTRRILRGYAMRPIDDPLICRGAITADHLTQARALGETLATGLELGIF